jgi:hypothetical protein
MPVEHFLFCSGNQEESPKETKSIKKKKWKINS